MKDYVLKVLVPYVSAKREELHLSSDQRALVIYDRYKGQCTASVLDLLEASNIDVVLIPANCTDRLQPLDVSVKKAAKNFMRDCFQSLYADQIKQQITNGDESPSVVVDLKLRNHCLLNGLWSEVNT